jgi:hypothetical protein
MDCRTALEILDREGTGMSGLPEADLAAAEAHLAGCGRCAAIVDNRRRLDRKIGRVLRAVDVPRGARQRLLVQLAALETADDDTGVASGEGRAASGTGNQPAVALITAEWANVAQAPAEGSRWWQRPLWRGAVPVAACLLVAAIGFFSVIWLMTPRWSVDEVRLELAKISFDSLETLRDFNGEEVANHLPADPGWQKLEWRSGQTAKGLPDGSSPHQFAVYGFVIPGRQRRPISGLLAVVPRHRMRAPPTAQSLSAAFSADSSSDYLPARIGQAVSVAWTDGDVVYVCLVEGGADSLDILRRILDAPAA